ncbi:MAG: alpha/beta fold hydrolase [Bdellovibrionaceae bacterium]|jgi:pimeloyl-ACP methyl ester carboxylesterase|nr:alpha/beta fold hydrolase [Pseudobdellovibrionaceae bacterium]
MKKFYFENTEPSALTKKIIKLLTKSAVTLAPRSVLKLAYHLLANPHSRREVKFDKIAPTERYKVKTTIGDVQLYHFSGGDKHILLTHGWADTSRSFRVIIQRLQLAGYSVWCFDHIGHGESDGKVSHLFGYIDGLKNVIKFIKGQGFDLFSIMSHSMGGAALLNLDHEYLNARKIIVLATPVLFFESMFARMDRVGISKRIFAELLADVSATFDQKWNELRPCNHKFKIDKNFLFIHDKEDPHCSYANLTLLLDGTEAKLLTTQGLGHRKILYDTDVYKEVLTFLKKKTYGDIRT